MEIILSNQFKSLTGSLGSGFGYHIQRRKNGFFSKRDSKGSVPPDGHWRFILTCACLAQNGLHIADIKCSWREVLNALYGARIYDAGMQVRRDYADKHKATYNARDIINLKNTFGL